MPAAVPKSHPRYASLVVRERLVEGARAGLVAWEGLLAHGRGEAFDYLLGERSVPEAVEAERAATAYLLAASHPILSVNGNVAVLAAAEVRDLAAAVGAGVEVNLFHRTEERVAHLVDYLEEAGLHGVLGKEATAVIPGLDQPRARCSEAGIFRADVVLVPLEDGDRAEALVRSGKAVLAVDLNPLSRTSQAATVAIADEVVRALRNMIEATEALRGDPAAQEAARAAYEKEANRAGVLRRIGETLTATPSD